MKRYIAVLLVVVFTLVGCRQPTSEQTDKQAKTDGKEWYVSALAKGKEAIIDEEYDKALASFDLALEYQANDAEATLLKSKSNGIKRAKVNGRRERKGSRGCLY